MTKMMAMLFSLQLLLMMMLAAHMLSLSTARELLDFFDESVYEDDNYAALQGLLKTVVKVFTSSVPPSFKSPWTNSNPREFTGTGFILDAKKKIIITNAHCVEYARTILLRKEGDHEKYEASLLAISVQVDIAILTVSDDAFWVGASPVTMGILPRMQQEIDVIGYPIGGDSVSITSGVVSRIDWLTYSQSSESQLCIQVDAAINPGNSGGPAFSKGRLVGVAFQGLPGRIADGVGYIIPVSVVEKVLEDFHLAVRESGLEMQINEGFGWYFNASSARLTTSQLAQAINSASQRSFLAGDNYSTWVHSESSPFHRLAVKPSSFYPLVNLRGFARAAFEVQHAENPYIRLALKLPEGDSGVIIRYTSNVSNLCGVFQNGDILVAVDGHKISNDGRVRLHGFQPLSFEAIITLKLVGKEINYTMYRDGIKYEKHMIAENPPRWAPLVSKHQQQTSYIMFAGLVFSPYSRDSEGMENWDGWLSTVMKQKGRYFEKPDDQIVIMTSMLPHRVSIGYSFGDVRGSGLLKVNDVEIRKISDVAVAIANATSNWITFLFANDMEIVIPKEDGFKATWDVKKDFRMNSIISKDIRNQINPIFATRLANQNITKLNSLSPSSSSSFSSIPSSSSKISAVAAAAPVISTAATTIINATLFDDVSVVDLDLDEQDVSAGAFDIRDLSTLEDLNLSEEEMQELLAQIHEIELLLAERGLDLRNLTDAELQDVITQLLDDSSGLNSLDDDDYDGEYGEEDELGGNYDYEERGFF